MSKQKLTPAEQLTQPSNLVYFDDRTALHLTQAFAQEVELEPLVELLFKQLGTVGEVAGLQYSYSPLCIDLNHGARLQHSAEYNLSFRDSALGTLTLYFEHAQHEQNITTCEDLISMAFISLRNAITTLALRNQPQPLSTPERTALAAVAPLATEPKSDALILLALDDYPQIKARDGDEWAQVLMSSVHEQIREGLRNADGVYHIGDDLIAVLLPNTTASQAEEVSKKVRALVASLHLRGGEISTQLTACMGLSDSKGASTAEDVMANAKLALAQAQTEGNNQIKFYRGEESDVSAQSSG